MSIFFHRPAYPENDFKLENRTIYTAVIPISESTHFVVEDKNPAPGVCLPIIVTFCQQHKVTIAPPSYIVELTSKLEKVDADVKTRLFYVK